MLDFSQIKVENLPWGITNYRIAVIAPWHEAPEEWDPESCGHCMWGYSTASVPQFDFGCSWADVFISTVSIEASGELAGSAGMKCWTSAV